MRVQAECKKDISWATGKFFLLTHFIFILLTKLVNYYFKLLTTMMTAMTEWPPPLPESHFFAGWIMGMMKFLRRKTIPHMKARLRKLKIGDLPVFTAKDALISASSVHNVKVNSQFKGRDEWVIEKVIISTKDSSILTAPTTFIQLNNLYLPIVNPSTRPQYVRAREIVGYLQNSKTYWDSPNKMELPKYEVFMVRIKSIIKGLVFESPVHQTGKKPKPDLTELRFGLFVVAVALIP
jgi:hypothetical protein